MSMLLINDNVTVYVDSCYGTHAYLIVQRSHDIVCLLSCDCDNATSVTLTK